jgi:DUF4097 and DUF4098 domain-containing protein YvlB
MGLLSKTKWEGKMRLMLVLVGIILVAVNAHASTYREDRVLSLEVTRIQELHISCGAGALVVQGQDREDIEIKAEIVVEGVSEEKTRDFVQENVELSLKKKGRTAYLISKTDSSFWGSEKAEVNLVVFIPRELSVNIKDGSGSIEARHIKGHVAIQDGSGSIALHHISGDLSIDDGSGDIMAEDIEGDVTIKDGSGSISTKKIGGNLSIVDGSGSIDVHTIGGSVVVDDGSGSINITGVEKNVTIESAGSGSCNISGVKGDLFMRD